MHGFLLIDKPLGMTSHQVLPILKKKLNLNKKEKIGHTGTLDPFATGLLVVGVGEALKFISYLKEEPKVYEAILKLGEATDTFDLTGKIIQKEDFKKFDREEIQAKVLGLLGEQDQIPPMYSAKKVDGQKLYDLARKGIEIERKAVKIRVDSLEILSVEGPLVLFRIGCSKGSYIRVLGSTIAAKLGTIGHLISLRRIQAGVFHINESHQLENIDETIQSHFLFDSSFFNFSDKLNLSEGEASKIKLGQSILDTGNNKDGAFIWLREKDNFIGIGECQMGKIKPKRLLSSN